MSSCSAEVFYDYFSQHCFQLVLLLPINFFRIMKIHYIVYILRRIRGIADFIKSAELNEKIK